MIRAFIKAERGIFIEIIPFVSEVSMFRWAKNNNREIVHYYKEENVNDNPQK